VKSQHSEASDLGTAALALEEDACCGCVVNKRPVGEGLKESESVEYGGRAVVALATAPDVMEKTERILHTRDLGREYGFTDIDGKEPLFYEGCEGWSAT
jgi:hypothetical protein